MTNEYEGLWVIVSVVITCLVLLWCDGAFCKHAGIHDLKPGDWNWCPSCRRRVYIWEKKKR